jgi:hypothetical protein
MNNKRRQKDAAHKAALDSHLRNLRLGQAVPPERDIQRDNPYARNPRALDYQPPSIDNQVTKLDTRTGALPEQAQAIEEAPHFQEASTLAQANALIQQLLERVRHLEDRLNDMEKYVQSTRYGDDES